MLVEIVYRGTVLWCILFIYIIISLRYVFNLWNKVWSVERIFWENGKFLVALWFLLWRRNRWQKSWLLYDNYTCCLSLLGHLLMICEKVGKWLEVRWWWKLFMAQIVNLVWRFVIVIVLCRVVKPFCFSWN